MPESATLYQSCKNCKGRGLTMKGDVCHFCMGMGLSRSRVLVQDDRDLPARQPTPISPRVKKMIGLIRRPRQR